MEEKEAAYTSDLDDKLEKLLPIIKRVRHAVEELDRWVIEEIIG